MTDNIQNTLSAAILRILRPLVRVLLNHGMSYGNFAELARKAFVEEGFDHVARSGKRPTISSAAALTGLTRKETKRLREAAEDGEVGSTQRYSRAIRVISGWVNDERFHDADGEPAPLPFEGESGSFAALVKAFSGDIPPAAMLSVLQASRNVTHVDGRVELLERAYIPMATPADKIDILGADVAELITTIGHNLAAPTDQRFFQRKVSNTGVGAEGVAEFRRLSNRKSQELLEEYHDWLSQHQLDAAALDAGEAVYVAVGIYYVEQSE